MPALGACAVSGVILVIDGLDTVTFGTWSAVAEFLDDVANGARTYTRRGARFISGDQRSAQNLGDGVYILLSVFGGKGLKSVNVFKKTGEAVKNLSKVKRNHRGRVSGVEHTQMHHVLHQKLKDNPLWDKAGINVETALNRMLLPTKEGATLSSTTRSIHEGRHLKHIEVQLRQKMTDVFHLGQRQGYSQSQYRALAPISFDVLFKFL